MKFENEVKHILETDPAARNSDKYLWVKLAQNLRIDTSRPLVEVLWEMPSFDTVSRTRRKLQEKHEELQADRKIHKARKAIEQEYREWALNFR